MSSHTRLVLAALALTVCPTLLPGFTAVGGGSASAAGTLFCCNDANGKQVCSDILPMECVGRAYRELGDSGRTLRVVEPPPTPEQRAQRAAAEERRRADEYEVRQKQRKDRALLSTYGSEADIDMMRTRAEEGAQKIVKAAEARITELQTQRKRFESEAEFYKKKALPPDIQKGLSDADFAIGQQRALIEAKKKDLEALLLLYENDRRRYLDLIRRSSTQ